MAPYLNLNLLVVFIIDNLKRFQDNIMVDVEKEEQILKLRSEVEIYKAKARDYKTKLKFELEQFKQKALQQEKTNCFKDLERLGVRTNELERSLETKNSKIQEYVNQTDMYRAKITKVESEFKDTLALKETELAEAKDKIQRITNDFKKRLSQEKQKHDQERMSLELEDRDENIKKIRLEFILSNQRKMAMQQKYLEQQLDKDLKQLAQIMNKSEMDLKRDQLVPSGSAVARLQELYGCVTSSLMYTKRLVSFMVFEQDGGAGGADGKQASQGTFEDDASLDRMREIIEEEKGSEDEPSNMPNQLQTQQSQRQKGPQQMKSGGWERNNFGPSFSQKAAQIPLDRLVKMHSYELIEVLLVMTIENFKMSGTPITTQLTQTMDLVQEKTDAKRTQEIRRQFLSDGKIHFQQYLLKLSDKIQNLQTERQMLQNELREVRVELSEQMDKYNQLAAQFVSKSEASPAAWSEKQIQDGEGMVREGPEGTSPSQNLPSERRETSIPQSDSPKAQRDNNQLAKFDLPLTKQNLILLQRENQALRERTKEIRLILNSKMDELQQVLKVTKQTHEHDLTSLKAECKDDIDRLRKQELQTQEMLKNQLRRESQQEISLLKENFEMEKQEVQDAHDCTLSDLNSQLEEMTKAKESYYIELQRRKGETNNLYEGGHGTFTIAFENPFYQQLLQKQSNLQIHRQNMDMLKASLKGKKKKQRAQLVKQEEIEAQMIEEVEVLSHSLENLSVQPLETLNHFIEVGFQVSRINFQLLQIYNEQTYDSMARKYSYEFQIPIDAISIIELENKLREQISQNFALFNEICPVYISLNMGRPVKDQDEICQHPIENFRIIDRKSSMVKDQFLTINFLKSDLPFELIRIVAFDNDTCETFQLDLTKDDLMILTDGRQSLLEESNLADLCSLLLNQLTMLDRPIIQHTNQSEMGISPSPMSNKNVKLIQTKRVLVVEHRCFFNEMVHKRWDPRNKLIIARHDKRKQGLIADCETSTDFEKGIMYEAFFDVYVGDATLPLQEPGQADHFEVILQQGSSSGHLKLTVKLKYTDVEQSLCLFNSDHETLGSSMNLAAALILPPTNSDYFRKDKYSALAYVISLEKVFGRDDAIIVRLVSIQRRFAEDMGDFQWKPDLTPNLSSTDFSCEVLYLIKKIGEPFAYTRVTDYEIMNTEARAQIFSHAFGFKQKAFDFGIDFETNNFELNNSDNLSPLALSMGAGSNTDNGKAPSSSNGHVSGAISGNDRHFRLAKPVPDERYTGNEVFLLRQFVLARKRSKVQQTEMDQQQNSDDEPLEEQVYAMVTLMYNERRLHEGILLVKINLPELNREFDQLVDVTNLIPQPELVEIMDSDRKTELSNRLFQRLFIEGGDSENNLTVVFDERAGTIHEEQREQRQKLFDEQVVQNNSDQVILQVPVPEQLGIESSQLQDCEKVSAVTLIGQRNFKVSCYFVNFLRNFTKVRDAMFDWQCIYLEAYLSSLDINLVIVITEKDLIQLMSMLKETTANQDPGSMQVDTEKLFFKTMTNQQLLNLVLDIVTLSQTEQMKLTVSFNHLQRRVKERNVLISNFQETGGRFIRKFGGGEDIDLGIFTTSIQQTEVSRKLIINIEKDFSDSKFDIKVYETRLQSRPQWRKLQVEVFQVEDPLYTFRCDYFSTTKQNGRQLLIERFNLSQQERGNDGMSPEENEKIRQKAMILTVTETSFPHQFNFMLLEPCSHIFWFYSHGDNKLNLMERRGDKQVFAQLLTDSIKNGIFRNVSPATTKLIQEGYQQDADAASKKHDGKVSLLLPRKNLEADFSSHKAGELRFVYGVTIEQEAQVFREVNIYFNQNASKFVVTSNHIEEAKMAQQEQKAKPSQGATKQPVSRGTQNSGRPSKSEPPQKIYEPSEIELQFLMMSYQEGFRYFQGVLVHGATPIVFQVEQACAFNKKDERAIRIQIKRLLSESTVDLLFDLIISERDLFCVPDQKGYGRREEKPPEVKQDKQTEIMLSYRESLASLPKMDDLALDLQTCETSKISDMPKLEEKKISWNMTYRKMMEDSDTGGRYVVTLLRKAKDPNAEVQEGSHDQNNVKLTLFDISSGAQDVFIFQEKEVLAQDQLIELRKKRSDPKSIFKKAVDARLRIKQLGGNLSFGAQTERNNASPKIMAFFANPALFDLPKTDSFNRSSNTTRGRTSSAGKNALQPERVADDPVDQLFSDIGVFDIRRGICSNLMNPDPDLNEVGTSSTQRSLLGQYERNEMFFDVYQDLDAFEVKLRINVFDRQTFKMISSAKLAGDELKSYLRTDKKNHLLEVHNREELGKYLVENILVDVSNKAMMLLKSQLGNEASDGA